jgi:hypothetical protein
MTAAVDIVQKSPERSLRARSDDAAEIRLPERSPTELICRASACSCVVTANLFQPTSERAQRSDFFNKIGQPPTSPIAMPMSGLGVSAVQRFR